jgi:hypothetical protein
VPDLDPMEDLGEPLASDDTPLATRLARIRSQHRREEQQDNLSLSKKLEHIKFHKEMEAEAEYQSMKSLAMDVLCRTNLGEQKRLHVGRPPSFFEVLVWTVKEAKSPNLAQRERWLDFCHGRELRGTWGEVMVVDDEGNITMTIGDVKRMMMIVVKKEVDGMASDIMVD